MKLEFSIVAEREVETAADYYENQQTGLGLRFISELNRSIDLILEFPEAWARLSRRSRRCVMRRFPYHIIYSVREQTVTIVTIVHQRRDPKRWQNLI